MNEFMVLINQAKNLATELKLKIDKESAREKINDEKLHDLSTRETVISEQETDLSQRDARIKGIESIVTLKEDAISYRRGAERLIVEVRTQKEANDLANVEAKAKITTRQKVLTEDIKKHTDDVDFLKKGWDELRAKEKTYKEEIKLILQKRLG